MRKSHHLSEIGFHVKCFTSIHINQQFNVTQKEKQTCNVEKMALSNSLYASQIICPLVIWSPTAVTALSKMALTLSIPPGKPIPPIEY